MKYSESPQAQRLSTKVANKLQHIIKTLDITKEQFAHRCGCSVHTLNDIMRRKQLPGPELARRMVLVIWEHKSFSYAPKLVHKMAEMRAQPNQETLSVKVPTKLKKRVVQWATDHGYSQRTLVILALERILDNEPALVVLADAMAKIQRTNDLNALSARPALIELLKGEPALAAKLHTETKLTQVRESEDLPVEKLAEWPYEAGPARPVFDPNDLEFEELADD